ncbi:PQ-loop repeat-containing protein 3 [Trebouxia sp. C0009 RCD-2024]
MRSIGMLSIPSRPMGTTRVMQQAAQDPKPCSKPTTHAPCSLSARRPGLVICAGPAAPVGTALVGSQQVATLLGYGVLAGSCVRSVPQILRMNKNKSAQGVSLTSNVAELVAYTINVAYNLRWGYPFSSYGEVVACWLQDVVIVGLIVRFNAIRGWKPWLGTAGFGVFLWAVMSGVCGHEVLYGLQASTVAIIALGGRVPQIWMNHQRGNSGELSIATCILNLAGNLARVFTTLVLTKDKLIMAGTALGVVLNSVLLAQSLQTAHRNRREEAFAMKQQLS